MNELNADFTSGQTVYAVLTNDANKYWNTSGTPAFETYNAAHWASYAIATVENGATGRYVGNFPTAITSSGTYLVEFRQQIGGTPSLIGPDPVVALGSLSWTGTAEAVVPTDPSNFSLTGVTASTATLAWTPGTGQTSQVLTVFDGAHNTTLQTINLGAGDAAHTVTGLSPGITYVFRIQGFSSAGNSGFVETGGTTSLTAAGVYWDLSDLYDWFGKNNIDIYSDLDNGATLDADRVQKRGNIADAWINYEWSFAGRPTPIPNTEKDYLLIRDVAAEWIGPFLAKGRGDIPEGYSSKDGFDNAMDGHIERAEKRLADLIFKWSENESDSAAVSTAGAITAVVGAPKQYPGTGNVRPPTITVPTLTGNVSW